MTLYQILSLIFGSGFLIAVMRIFYTTIKQKIKCNEEQTEALKLGVQALLRDRLYAYYNKYSELEYAPIYARENFENIYKQYHNLGNNGVMDDIYRKFMKLPTDNERND